MTFHGDYEREPDLISNIAFALQQSGALRRKDRMDEPQIAVARKVVEHLKRCGYIVTPGKGVGAHSTRGQ